MAQMWTAPEANWFERTGAVICLVAIIAFGIYAVADTLSSHKKAEQSARWPQAMGTLVDGSEVVHYRTSRNVLASIISAYTDLEVSYTYTVRGKSYIGTTAAFEKSIDAGEFIKNHSVGDQITVYYNPKKPAEAVLFPGPEQAVFVLYEGVSLFIAGCGFFPLVNAASGWVAYDMQMAKCNPKKTRKKKAKKK